MLISYFTAELSEQIQYINMICSLTVIILFHIMLRRNPKQSLFFLPIMFYFYELLVFYFVRIVVTYFGAYNIETFTAISSLIRLQFSASMMIVLIYFIYKGHRGRS